MNPQIPNVHSKMVRLVFFWIGLFSTIAYRMIIFFSHGSSSWLQGVWYFGTIGYVIYFAHRYEISRRRARVIEQFQLATKVPQLKELTPDEQRAMSYVFASLGSSKEKWNYIAIFVLSTVALVYGFLVDFVK